jgi:ABC-type tungstate transport system substrate-binding protein
MLLEPTRLPRVLEAIELGLLSTHADANHTAATIAFNCSLYISRQDIDMLLALVAPVVHCLQSQQAQSNENISMISDTLWATPTVGSCSYRYVYHVNNVAAVSIGYALLMTLGKLMYKCNQVVELLQTLELQLDAYLAATSTDKVREVAREVQALIAATPTAAAASE